MSSRLESVSVINQYVRETDKTIYKLTTHSGREVVATDNHPFITEEGWKSVCNIYASPNKKLGIIPNWLFLDSNVPTHTVAISKEQMVQRLEHYGVKESLITKHLLVLGSLGLCPLYADDERLPVPMGERRGAHGVRRAQGHQRRRSR